MMLSKETITKATRVLSANGMGEFADELLSIVNEKSDSNNMETPVTVVKWYKDDFVSAFDSENVRFSEERYQQVLPELVSYLHSHENDFEVFGNIITSHFKPDNATTIKELWKEFNQVPIDKSGHLLKPFKDFPEKTHVEDVWKWFETNYHIRIYDLLFRFNDFDDSFILK